MSVLAIEAGPTAVTAVVVAGDGEVLGRCVQDLPAESPHRGWVEHEPDELWGAVLATTRLAVKEAGATGDAAPAAVGLAHPGDTLVLWDQETLGAPRPAFGASDRRTAQLCDRLRAAGHEQRVVALAAAPLDPRRTGPRLAWLAEHEPHTWAHVLDGRYAVGTFGSYLLARMTLGTWYVTDVASAAATLLLDTDRGAWSDELCALFGVPVAALPELVASRGRLARTEPRGFSGLGLPVTALAESRVARAAAADPTHPDAVALGAAALASRGLAGR